MQDHGDIIIRQNLLIKYEPPLAFTTTVDETFVIDVEPFVVYSKVRK
jgi:hypothetical protein